MHNILLEQATKQELAKFAWMGLSEEEFITAKTHKDALHSIVNREIKDPARFLLSYLIRPEYFFYTCKHILNVKLVLYQAVILRLLWRYSFPMMICTRGGGKSFMLAVYALLRALILQGRKIVITGTAFRQAKYVMEYIERIWTNAPVLRDLAGGRGIRKDNDEWYIDVGESRITALPMGTGEKIRGKRAHDLISDEFQSINRIIFETVVSGFSAVSADPVERTEEMARQAYLGIKIDTYNDGTLIRPLSNQRIISGTASYIFTHFGEYWSTYKAMVESRGDTERMKEKMKDIDMSMIDWRDICIIRLPHDLIPPGFMDEKNLNMSKATQNVSIFKCEYGAVFLDDSQGYFKRSLIESCVANDLNNIELPSSGRVIFRLQTRGTPNIKHVIGVDPASESDNFTIVILALYPDHRRIVYCWSTTRKQFMDRFVAQGTGENDFFDFVARKIYDLMQRFSTVRIAMDAMGGGIAVMEALKRRDNYKELELPILPILNPDDPQITDRMPGHHILDLIQFSRYEWVCEANTGLKYDMESKILLFPFIDPVTLALVESGSELEDCVFEVEELKNELSTIQVTKTPKTGRDHWDTPEYKTAENKKGRLKKDRYSALLMANMTARTLVKEVAPPMAYAAGGFVGGIDKRTGEEGGPLYTGTYQTEQEYGKLTKIGTIVRRRTVY